MNRKKTSARKRTRKNKRTVNSTKSKATAERGKDGPDAYAFLVNRERKDIERIIQQHKSVKTSPAANTGFILVEMSNGFFDLVPARGKAVAPKPKPKIARAAKSKAITKRATSRVK